MPKIIYTSISFLLYVYISANISKILTLSRKVDDLNKKGLARMMANPLKVKSLLVPRDRIELPTRGFSDQY